ncbi:DUF6686 family protein [uncultured Lacinutrix sp.]|uniref:DUF6686 family protein n=1 Tax=uncultured Lacinutrix sp. TaxID=574032 RepID=UPI0026114DD9|nr:DUF6686 family protein [uncultured Lacinutrix sp.]
MCDNIKLITKVKSGELTMCKQCNMYQLTYNNLYFEFNNKEFNSFKSYLFNIELEYWEHKYACPKIQRKIPIPSLQKNLYLVFNRQEINELKTLVSSNKKDEFLDFQDIDYKLIIN